jgi:hypothetical protein
LWKEGNPERGDPRMEGTSGAADRAPLRGGMREAALSSGARWLRAPRTQASSKGGACEAGSCGARKRVQRRRHLQPAPRRAGNRRCPSRLGWGEASSASDRGGRRQRPGTLARVFGPWPSTSRLAALRKEQSHLQPSCRKAARRDQLHRRATAGVVLRGSDELRWCSRIVSIAEVDKRARGPFRPRVKSSWIR